MADPQASFTRSMPEYYDSCLGPAWFDTFAADLVQRVPAKPPGDVLEIACGTGQVTRRLRERLDPALRLVATDLSKAMLDYGRSKRRDRKGIEWREADAVNLPFGAGEFGAVVCAFGVMFVPDKQAVFRRLAAFSSKAGPFCSTSGTASRKTRVPRCTRKSSKDYFPETRRSASGSRSTCTIRRCCGSSSPGRDSRIRGSRRSGSRSTG